jgi:hypothetical protein
MKRAEIKAIPGQTHQLSRKASSRGIDPALIKLVEALAIADARRDHLFESQRLTRYDLDALGEERINTGVRDEARGDLCPVEKDE